MNRTLTFSAVALLLLVGAGCAEVPVRAPVVQKMPTATAPVAASRTHDDFIRVTNPTADQLVVSPLAVTGEARGSWYFEASFPVVLYDAYGQQLAAVPAQAQGDWMTTNFVSFKANLTFSAPTTETGTLVLKRDNPSGLPQNDDELRIPVKFNVTTRAQKAIKLYYYDFSKDRDTTGNVLCSRQGHRGSQIQDERRVLPCRRALVPD
jgi:hypothetical protein